MSREHGTYVKYVQDECRCEPCRAANREYERARKARRVPPYVGADRARQHVRFLAEHGMGLKSVSRAAGISHGAMSKLMYGERGRAPSKRIRRATEQKILALTLHDAPGGTREPAGPIWKIIDELLARGWTGAAIARAYTGNPNANAIQLSRDYVERSNARAIRALLDQPVPPRRSKHGLRMVPELVVDRADIDDEQAPDPLFDLTPLPEGVDLSWKREAACRHPDVPNWIFFPARGDVATLAAAREVCARCPVHEACLEFALVMNEMGVWGGTSEKQRRDMRRRQRVAP